CAALAMTERALRLAPDDEDTQFTHAMLLLDADRAGMTGKLDELLRDLPGYAPTNRINIAVRVGKQGHARFSDVLDVVLPPERDQRGASYDDVAEELLCDLGQAIATHAPAKLHRVTPLLPKHAMLLAALAWRAYQADQRNAALALYERLVEAP